MRSLRFLSCGILFVRGRLLRLPCQHPAGEGRYGAVLHRLSRPDYQVEEAAGDLALPQLLLDAQVAPLVVVGRVAAAGGVLAGAEVGRHGGQLLLGSYVGADLCVGPFFDGGRFPFHAAGAAICRPGKSGAKMAGRTHRSAPGPLTTPGTPGPWGRGDDGISNVQRWPGHWPRSN